MLQQDLQQALEHGRHYLPQGRVADYIPELGKADPNALGICLYTNVLQSRVSAR